MISRTNYCKSLLQDYMREYKVTNPKDLIQYVYASSTLGVVLQELKIINQDEYPLENTYINDRGGIMKTYSEKDENEIVHIEILTLREFLDLLPDTVENLD